ncbi:MULTISPECIES: YciI family protein [unclassified Corallococcus]|uniref:YciI family protein n=1 Tax=unclassified Corallococcus TaxID=2685029 RepID=UPI001A8F4568|nr:MULTISPECIES: YciI family protein [unclassified Corallococcus]MBN9685550.1 dehydrogenase [Corallococcus sp. NCSPR001]WAS83002.1 YciI family protein [Corallococcus sp. NCRR]
MAYMLVVKQVGNSKAFTEEENRVAAARMERMLRFGASLQERGIFLAGDSLRSDAEGVRVERRDGKLSFSDGPFTESKEIIGGFFLVDVKTREEALELATQCPAAEWSTVEVRQCGPCYEP